MKVQTIGFERGKNPKKTLGIGKLSTQILDELEILAGKWKCTEGKIEERDMEKILSYGRIPPKIQCIVKVWQLETDKKITKLILYDERIEEKGMWGLKNVYTGLIYPWIFKTEFPKEEDNWSMSNRSSATEYLKDLKWHQELNF